LTLVRDPHRSHGVGATADLVASRVNHLARALPDLLRIVLDPSRLGIDLLVLELLDGGDIAAVVEQHAARTGCSLVQCCDVISHASSLLLACQRLNRCLAEVISGGRAWILV